MAQKKKSPSFYAGCILQGKFSPALKTRVKELIEAFEVFDATGVPGIPYITAWLHNDQIMWYEFAGREFTDLFGCTVPQLAGVFRESVVDHRIFRRAEVEAGVRETSRSGQELSGSRSGLRAEVARQGNVEADYKVLVAGNSHVWFKDRARVETFSEDGLSLSFGILTDVTNEMMHKDLLEQIGYIDHLTGLPNRTIMHRSLEIKISEYERNHIDDFIFLLMDIDHFKSVNDNHGHRAGDYVLATMAQVMNDVKRRADEIGRYGGEEFYGLAMGDIYEGQEFAERIRRRVEVTPFVFEDQLIPLTISIGIVAASEVPELKEKNLIDMVDKRLYRAKHHGRNQVVWETNSL